MKTSSNIQNHNCYWSRTSKDVTLLLHMSQWKVEEESNIYSLFIITMIPHSYHLVCLQPSIGSDFLWSFRKISYKIKGKKWWNYVGHFHMLCISSQLNYPLCFQWASWFPKRCGSWGRAADWLFQPLSFKLTLCVCVLVNGPPISFPVATVA